MFKRWSNHSWYRGFLIMGWLCIIQGPLFIIGSGWAYKHNKNFIQRAAHGKGTVVELIERHGNGDITFSPVYTFSDNEGTVHKIYSSCSSYPPRYEVGEKIEVIYDPVQPQNAKINSYFEIWGLATILLILGAIDCVIGPVLVYFGKRLKRKSERVFAHEGDTSLGGT